MNKRILGYEIYTSETPEGRPLFKVTELVDMGSEHMTNVLYATEDWDDADAYMRSMEKRKAKATCCVYHYGGGTYGECGGPAHLDY